MSYFSIIQSFWDDFTVEDDGSNIAVSFRRADELISSNKSKIQLIYCSYIASMLIYCISNHCNRQII